MSQILKTVLQSFRSTNSCKNHLDVMNEISILYFSYKFKIRINRLPSYVNINLQNVHIAEYFDLSTFEQIFLYLSRIQTLTAHNNSQYHKAPKVL